jgi:enhancing lycopene biosynthesis protein 2
MKKVAVVLAGCGHKDGAEITEAVSLLVELSRAGLEATFFAPDQDFGVRDPISNKTSGEHRNVLLESARITRGQIFPLTTLDAAKFDALAFPGGTGVANNLCNWAEKGSAGTVQPEVARVIKAFHSTQKPIAAICIAPVLLAQVLGKFGPTLTIGKDLETAQEIEKTGAHHQACAVTETCVDSKNLLVTTPAYMFGKVKPHEVFTGISNLVKELEKLLQSRRQ